MADKKKKKAASEETEQVEGAESAEETTATAVEDSSDSSSDSSSSSSSSDSDSDSHDHEHDHAHDIEWVEDPKFDIDYKGDCAYEVKVTIPAANEGKQAEKMFEELRSEAELPGFRRGRAPKKLLERKFGKAVKGDVEGKLVSGAFQKLIEDEDLNPVGYPDIDGLEELKERKDGEPIEVTLKFEVSPRVELGKYLGVEVERPFVTIDEKDVDDAVKGMLERNATYEAMDKITAEENDQVIMDFKGTIDGEPFEGGSRENFPYILGSGYFFPEFEEVLKGAKPGSELETEITFPEDYHSEDVRGKTAKFEIKVNEIKRRVTPELTDELAKEQGAESAEDLRTKVREQLEKSAQARSKQIAESRGLRAVIEDSSYEIPKSVVERIAADSKEDEIRRLMSGRVPMHMIQERMGEIEERARDRAIENIKRIVTLNEIADAEGIHVTEEDWEQEAEHMGQSLGLDAELVAQYLQTADDRATYEDRIFRSKALKVIMDNATITEKELTRDEMDQVDEEHEGDED